MLFAPFVPDLGISMIQFCDAAMIRMVLTEFSGFGHSDFAGLDEMKSIREAILGGRQLRGEGKRFSGGGQKKARTGPGILEKPRRQDEGSRRLPLDGEAI
ncbi:hypothetical protein [Chitiniphilus shinanonensis]|uniref:hypothetical protein n=1 Tax=Chitiniphilus shinanonensis TaxID=553088 RepID=UPI003053C636